MSRQVKNSNFRSYVCAKRQKFSKKKRGVSEMIGYILLVTIGIAMSILVFTWLKGYVPKEAVECSEGVSLFVKDYTCIGNTLTITLKNNGRFSISGYLIHATTAEGQELATQDLSEFCENCFNRIGEVKFSGGLAGSNTNSLVPSSEGQIDPVHTFDFLKTGTHADFTKIYSVEIVPTRYEIINGKNRLATCTKAKVKQEIRCSA